MEKTLLFIGYYNVIDYEQAGFRYDLPLTYILVAFAYFLLSLLLIIRRLVRFYLYLFDYVGNMLCSIYAYFNHFSQSTIFNVSIEFKISSKNIAVSLIYDLPLVAVLLLKHTGGDAVLCFISCAV